MPDPNTDQTPDPKQDPTAGDKTPDKGKEPKTFTQEELDQIVKDRVKREREKFTDYDVLKDKASKFDEAEGAKKTAEQKAQEAADAAKHKADEAIAKANARLLRAEIVAKAAGKFVDPEDVVTALSSKLTVADDGTIDGLDEELAALAKAKPHWVKQPAKGGQNTGNPSGGGDGAGETLEQRRARVYGSGGSVFDPAAARERGGGVRINEK